MLSASKEVFKSKIKWENIFSVDFDWEEIFLKPIKTTPDTKLRWFQFRIIHRLLSTNSYLVKIKMASNDKCSFCKDYVETLTHLFWECSYVQNFWTSLSDMLLEKCYHICNLTFTPELVIFGCKNNFISDDVFDLIILLAKFHIYKCKLTAVTPNITHFKRILCDRYEIEKTRYFTKCQNVKFYQKWMLYHHLVAQ